MRATRIGRWKVHLYHRRKRGLWEAFRDRPPYFCVESPTRFGAILVAARALRLYRDIRTKAQLSAGKET